ncbi:hypothetical protein GJAV_G00184430 [Gymnothorax javanicus]|nr:hypothetical protein GJAV_G00184430 [Gymnothorax javanicus]
MLGKVDEFQALPASSSTMRPAGPQEYDPSISISPSFARRPNLCFGVEGRVDRLRETEVPLGSRGHLKRRCRSPRVGGGSA